MKQLFLHLKPNSEKGQSLVEMAIITPILIFLLLGVFEVGWALRGYLVLTNVNREITRFAIRPGYLDYAVKDNTSTAALTVGYNKVVSYTYTTLSDQLGLDFSGKTGDTLIVSHIVVDTAQPCRDLADCDCNSFITDPNYYKGSKAQTVDDLILHPGVPGYEKFYAQTFPVTSTYQTKLDYATLAARMARENNKFNCDLLKKSAGTLPSANNAITTEIYYHQKQLFGFPLISNPFTDPVKMYASTTMRMTVASRTGQNIDTVGPTCELYPMTFKDTAVLDPNDTPRVMNIWDGDGGGNMGWTSWNSSNQSNVVSPPGNATNSEGYLGNELTYPRMSMNDFIDATDSSDTSLNLGDHVKGNTGTINSSDTRALLEALVGKTILVPVFSSQTGTGANAYYTISHFARVQINSVCLSNSNDCPGPSKKAINAVFLGYQDNACDSTAGGGGGGGGGTNNPPTAVNDTATTTKNTAVTINVLANDTDPDGDTLTIKVGSIVGPSGNHGLVIVSGGNLLYTPQNNDVGTYTFTYTVTDGKGGESTATVTVTINNSGSNTAPVAVNDTATATTGVQLIISAASLLSNDTDANGDTLTIQSISDYPDHGALGDNGNGTFTYRSDAGYVGSDFFIYVVSDGQGGTASGTVNITVTAAANQLPVASNDSYSTNENTALNIAAPGVLSNDTDANSDPLTAIKVSNPAHGTVTLNSNGSFVYTPASNYNGSDSFTYKANDGKGDSNVATVQITVNAASTNQLPVANNDSYTTRKNQNLSVAASGVLSNDTDGNSDPLTAIKFSNPANGTVTLNSNGSFVYNPNSAYVGPDSFTYKANDGKGDSNVATVNITITN